jgi:hypothetical protein
MLTLWFLESLRQGSTKALKRLWPYTTLCGDGNHMHEEKGGDWKRLSFKTNSG